MKKPSFNAIKSYVQANQDHFIQMRRFLHQHPELGREEYKTSAYMRHEAQKIGYENIEMVGATGFTFDLVRDPRHPYIALRADIDALPIHDEKRVAYKSQNNGICHACGHDFHTTVVYGVAHTLGYFRKFLDCNVRFIFQHAEEPIPGGAIDFVDSGKLDNIVTVYGLHADPELPVGKIGLREGWISAQSIQLIFDITGTGGHSSRPHQAADPLFIGIMILSTLHSALARLQDPEMPFIFTMGRIDSGTSYNSIASSFHAEGTLRVTNEKQADYLLKNISNIVNNITSLFDVSANFDFKKGAPPVVNDPDKTGDTIKKLERILSPGNIVQQRRSFGGEDFSVFLEKSPGVFINFGIRGDAKQAGLHTGYFDIDEQAIPFAIAVYSWLLIQV